MCNFVFFTRSSRCQTLLVLWRLFSVVVINSKWSVTTAYQTIMTVRSFLLTWLGEWASWEKVSSKLCFYYLAFYFIISLSIHVTIVCNNHSTVYHVPCTNTMYQYHAPLTMYRDDSIANCMTWYMCMCLIISLSIHVTIVCNNHSTVYHVPCTNTMYQYHAPLTMYRDDSIANCMTWYMCMCLFVLVL